MLLIILALFWVALLAPVVIRRLRDGSTDRSIDSFHAEHEVLSRQPHAVEPAHRLDQPDAPLLGLDRRPRLTVVHADDTYGSLETRSSWDEWSQDYDYDDATHATPARTNHYADAYSSRVREVPHDYETHSGSRTMRAQRKMIFTRTLVGAVVLTLLGFISGFAPLIYLSLLAWLGLVGYVGLALYAVREGYLDAASISSRLASRAPLATVQPLYDSPRYEPMPDNYDEGSGFYAQEESESWYRSAPPRRALG